MLSTLSLLPSPFRNASHLQASDPLQPWRHLFSPAFFHKEIQPFLPWRGGQLRHSKVSCTTQGQGRGQEFLLLWAGLMCIGHFLICRMRIPLVNPLLRNALHPQVLTSRSAFPVGFQGATQAPGKLLRSKPRLIHTLIILNKGRQAPARLQSRLRLLPPVRCLYPHSHILLLHPRDQLGASGSSSSPNP